MLVLAAIGAVLMAGCLHWARVQYGDFKYPGRRTGRRQEFPSALVDDGRDPEGPTDA